MRPTREAGLPSPTSAAPVDIRRARLSEQPTGRATRRRRSGSRRLRWVVLRPLGRFRRGGAGRVEERSGLSAIGLQHAGRSRDVDARGCRRAAGADASREDTGLVGRIFAHHRDRPSGLDASRTAASRAGEQQPGVCDLHFRLLGPPQGCGNHAREPAESNRVARIGVRRHAGRSRQPGRRLRIRCHGLGTLAASGRWSRAFTSPTI